MYLEKINAMHLLTYQAKHFKNLYRLCSIGGHTSEDLSHAFDYIFAEPHATLGIILDIQNGLSLFPKEGAVVFARKANEYGIKACILAVVVQQDDIENVRTRYELYPELVRQYIEMTVELFSNEAEATLWINQQLTSSR
ncbi:MAG: hypothetical protein ACNI26_15950 [Terasakiella sp.]|uniref:hypothetical protein n=1 Tax=unclassified Terasakiella TaxID=2614952 RepID=UPI003B00675E